MAPRFAPVVGSVWSGISLSAENAGEYAAEDVVELRLPSMHSARGQGCRRRSGGARARG
jgi:hypothetical protein